MHTLKNVTDRYHFHGEIARGSYGHVYRATDRATGEAVAVKAVRVERDTSPLLEEVQNHACLDHPNVIRLREVRLLSESSPEGCHRLQDGDLALLVMDYATRGTLRQELAERKGPLHESEARTVFQQLISAVGYCHEMGIVSRDVKLSNILLDECPVNPGKLSAKLCDFGFSKCIRKDSKLRCPVGTLNYAAPEVLRGGVYDKEVDVWSCGVVLYMMVTGHKPFGSEPMPGVPASKHVRNILSKIIRGQYKVPKDVDVSPACRDLIARCLVTDPRKRAKIHEIMQHPWLRMGTKVL